MIVQVVADDLGYNDLGFTNNGKTHTPNIDEAVGNGVLLTAYHTYKVCSPTRAACRCPFSVTYSDAWRLSASQRFVYSSSVTPPLPDPMMSYA